MSSVSINIETELVVVNALPDEVAVELHLGPQDGCLTPAQARQLAQLLVEAADESQTLDWVEDDRGGLKIVSK